MTFPVSRTDLVPDKRIERSCVRRTQIGFSQTHQCNTFLGGEFVLRQELLHQSRLCVTANRTHKFSRMINSTLQFGLIKFRARCQTPDGIGFITKAVSGNLLSEFR